MKYIKILSLVLVFSISVFAQADKTKKPIEKDKPAATNSKTATPMDLAKAALLAHGGDKFKNMKTSSATVELTKISFALKFA